MQSNVINNLDPSKPGQDRSGANVVSSTMSSAEIVALLTLHQCPDITHELHLDQCGEAPVFGGGFGDIYQGALRGGERVAIKCARLFPQQDDTGGKKVLKRTARELYTWSRLKHENVLRLFGLAQFRGQVAMVSSWMSNGTLPVYIKRNPGVDRYRLSVNICEGVTYLHENNMVHGDIKGANVLVSDKGVAKLADFGCTELKESDLYFTTTTKHAECSMRWAAPEILNGEGARSKRADVYALGMTLLEVVTSMMPFSNMPNNMTVAFAVCVSRKFPERPKEFPSFKEDEVDPLWELMMKTWAYSVSDRPDSSAVKNQLKEIRQQVSEDTDRASPPESASSHCIQVGQYQLKREGVTLESEQGLLLGQGAERPAASTTQVSGTTSTAFFIAFPNVYAFDRHRLICRVDDASRYRQVDSLKPNPPNPETIFYLEEMPYWFDSHNYLWYNLYGQWYPEKTYSDLSSVGAKLARCAEPDQLAPPVASTHMSVAGTTSEAAHGPRREGPSSDDEYLYPPLGTHPGRVQVDAWFEEFKARRAALWKTRERVLEIRCPMEECRKAQKCPQALRDHLYFHFSIKRVTLAVRMHLRPKPTGTDTRGPVLIADMVLDD